jgi:hypothetical protein
MRIREEDEMRHPRSFPILAGLLLAALLLQACGGPEAPPPTATLPPPPPPPTETPAPSATPPAPTETATPAHAPGYEAWLAYAGDWSGAWQNQTFGTTGEALATVTVRDDGTAEIVLDLGGFVFGVINPPPITLSGTYTATDATFGLEEDPTFGNIAVTFTAQGEVIATFANLLLQGGSMSVTGTFTPQRIEMNYSLSLGSINANGVLNLDHE